MAGIFINEVVNTKNNSYTPTKKILIIGESGSGKTTLACNLIYYYIKPFSYIVFVTPSKDDGNLNIFRELCEKSGIYFFIKDDKTFLSVPEIEGGGVWVIDDYYTSTGRNPEIEILIKELVNRGRHTQKHIIYCAQLANRLPPEIKLNNTDLFLSHAVALDEKNYEKLNVPKPLDKLEECEDKKWYKYENRKFYEVDEIPPVNRHQIIQKLKLKIPYSIRKGKIVDDNNNKLQEISKENGNKLTQHHDHKNITLEEMIKLFNI